MIRKEAQTVAREVAREVGKSTLLSTLKNGLRQEATLAASARRTLTTILIALGSTIVLTLAG